MFTTFVILMIIAWTVVGIMFKCAIDSMQSESFHKMFTHARIGAILLTGLTIITFIS